MNDLRVASGTKFDYVLDSYLYAAVQLELADDFICLAEVTVYLLTGNLGELILAAARHWRVTEPQLGFTPDEHEHLNTHEAAVLLEDDYGRCEVNWFTDANDAWNLFHEYHVRQTVSLSPATYCRTMDRLLAGAEGG